MAQIKIRNCCVPSCKETHVTSESFFRFPNDPRDRKRWKSAIGFPQDFEVIFVLIHLTCIPVLTVFFSQTQARLCVLNILWNEILHRGLIVKQAKKRG